MRIKRLQLDVEFEADSLHVFHTDYPVYIDDPPTIIEMNGHQFEGDVEYRQSSDTYEIKITKRRKA